MKEISCKLLVIGAGPGGYVCAIRAGQLGIDTVDRRGGEAGRHLPQRRLHPVQGADPCRRRIREGRRTWRPARRRSASRSPTRDSTSAQTVAWKDGIVGRLTSGVAGLLKKARVKIVHGWATFRDGKTVEVETETGPQVDPRRDRGDRHRLGAGRTAVPAVRRPR